MKKYAALDVDGAKLVGKLGRALEVSKHDDEVVGGPVLKALKRPDLVIPAWPRHERQALFSHHLHQFLLLETAHLGPQKRFAIRGSDVHRGRHDWRRVAVFQRFVTGHGDEGKPHANKARAPKFTLGVPGHVGKAGSVAKARVTTVEHEQFRVGQPLLEASAIDGPFDFVAYALLLTGEGKMVLVNHLDG